MIINIRAALRGLTFALGLSSYFLAALLIYPIYLVSPMQGRFILCRLISFYARFACWFMGIEVEIEDRGGEATSNYLMVSNHLSYTDILAICGHFPACFVTSVEIKKTPVLGQICELAGCLFVERRNKTNLSNEIKEITEALKEGLNVVIFPEATSTDGSEVIRFRRPLFQAALDSGKSIRPMTVNYMSLDSIPVTLNNRDRICWYGDMTFPDHLWGVFKIKRTKVKVIVSPVISPADEDDNTSLSSSSHEVVSSHYKNIQ